MSDVEHPNEGQEHVTSITHDENVNQSVNQEKRSQSPQPAPSESETFDVTEEYDVAASLSEVLAEQALNPNDPKAFVRQITSQEMTDTDPKQPEEKKEEKISEETNKPTIDSFAETESKVKSIETLDLDLDEPKIIDDPKDDDDDLQVANVGEEEEEDEEDDDDIDETLVERLIGLTEMFPETFRNGVCSITSKSCSLIKNSYSLSRTLVWVFFSSSSIMVAPLFFEMERLQAQRSLGKEMLLGPGAQPGGGMMGMPPPPVK